MELPKTRLTIILVAAVIFICVGFIVKNFLSTPAPETKQSVLPVITDVPATPGISITPALSPVAQGIEQGKASNKEYKTYDLNNAGWVNYKYKTAEGKEIMIQVPVGDEPPPGATLEYAGE